MVPTGNCFTLVTMTTQSPQQSFSSWLTELSDEQLLRLLELRPDLAHCPPSSITALASRASTRHSIMAAADELNFLQLAVIDALLFLHADTTAVTPAAVIDLVAQRAEEHAVRTALADIQERAMAWGTDKLRVPAETAAALPWYRGQVMNEEPLRGADDIAAALHAINDEQRAMLQVLANESPIGRTRDAAAHAPQDRPVPQLLAAGLLRRLDDETVLLPRQVGHILRGEICDSATLDAPEPVINTHNSTDTDAYAAGAVMDFMREIELVFNTVSATPVPSLRSGGMGVRETKRLMKITGIDEQRLSLILELTATAGLLACGEPDPSPPNDTGLCWGPTIAADRFLDASTADRWYLLASTWLQLAARPSLVGSRDPDGKNYVALSDSIYSTAASLDRHLVLALFTELPPGSAIDAEEVSRVLLWRRPRWAARLQREPVAHLLDEAHALGFLGRGALSTPARALLAGDEQEAIAAMAKILPAPIDHFMVQADLTVVAPGPLQRDLADQLSGVATVESAGAAMVYRISEQSIRQALDSGRTADMLHTFFEKHSTTPVPQGLTYLINDVARRHGQLRVGRAASFVRCEDPALLARAVATPAAHDLGMRVLAPTVAICQAPISEVLATLRDAGLVPAAEDCAGAIVDIGHRGSRVPPAQHRRIARSFPQPGPDTLKVVVATLRKMSKTAMTPMANVRLDPEVAMALLQQAAEAQAEVLMGYVDNAGMATQRMVRPLVVNGGQLLAWDSATGYPREFSMHRVTTVIPEDPE